MYGSRDHPSAPDSSDVHACWRRNDWQDGQCVSGSRDGRARRVARGFLPTASHHHHRTRARFGLCAGWRERRCTASRSRCSGCGVARRSVGNFAANRDRPFLSRRTLTRARHAPSSPDRVGRDFAAERPRSRRRNVVYCMKCDAPGRVGRLCGERRAARLGRDDAVARRGNLMYCTVLYCTVLYFNDMQCNAMQCNAM